MQAGSFTLATLTFNALANGVSAFSLTVKSASRYQRDSLTAPEPSTLALFGAGLLSCLGLNLVSSSLCSVIIGPLKDVTGFSPVVLKWPTSA